MRGNRRPTAVLAIVVLLFFLGLSAVGGGVGLLSGAAPSEPAQEIGRQVGAPAGLAQGARARRLASHPVRRGRH